MSVLLQMPILRAIEKAICVSVFEVFRFDLSVVVCYEDGFHAILRVIHGNEPRFMLCKNGDADVGKVERIHHCHLVAFLSDEPECTLKHINLRFQICLQGIGT